MNWINSLIRGTKIYQELQSLATESATARVLAEDRCRALEDNLGFLREQIDQARAETLEAHKKLENILWEQKYGTKLYPEAGPELPAESPEPQPVKARGIQARSLVRRAQRSLIDSIRNVS